MNARSSLLFAALMLGLAALTFNACSGSTNDGNNATSGGTSSGSSGSPNNPDCPATDPKEGDCSKPDLVCEYGDDFNPLCNVVRVCSGNRWSSPLVRSNKPQCPTTAPPTVKPNPAVCPAARSGIPAGSTCANPQDGGDIKCSYDGATCTCGNFCKSYPVQMPDCDTDAGQTENCCDRTQIAWYCFEGPAFCKSPRPRVGSPCT